MKNIFDSIHSKNNSFCKNVPNFWPLTPKLSYKISRNPFKDVHLDEKIYWNLPETLWNATTVIMLCTVKTI